MSKVLVVAPHPDDEILGCGGTILKHIERGDDVHWLIITNMSASKNYTQAQIERREQEIELVQQQVGFKTINQLDFAPAGLSDTNKGQLIQKVSQQIHHIQPDIVFMPHSGDVHSDHQHVGDAVIAATKSFRAPFIRELLVYETISETDYAIASEQHFIANTYVDISKHLSSKINLLNIYQSEINEFPFPRSAKALEALALLRGSQCNALAAEAFMLLKRIC